MAESITSRNNSNSRLRFVIAGLLIVFNIGHGINFIAPAPVLPLITEELQTSQSTASLLISIVLIVQVALGIPAGFLVSRLGTRWSVFLSCVLGSAVSFSLVVESFPVLLATRVTYSLGFALIMPLIGQIAREWFPSNELVRINSIWTFAQGLGIFIVLGLGSPLADTIGWRGMLSVFGAILPLVGILSLMVLPSRVQKTDDVPHISFMSVYKILRSKSLLLLALADAGPYALYNAASTWLPTYYHKVHQMSLSAAGLASSLLPISGMVGVALAGIVSLHEKRRKPFLLVAGLVIGVSSFGVFLSPTISVSYACLMLLGFSTWLFLPFWLALAIDQPNIASHQVGIHLASLTTITTAFSIISPITIGIAADQLGNYLPGFLVWACLSWSLFLLTPLLHERESSNGNITQHRKEQEPQRG